MERLHLETNDYVTYIFIFVIQNGVPQYYFSDKTEWFMDNWPYLYNNEHYLSEALHKILEDKVLFSVIENEFLLLKKENNFFVIETHLPMLYVNFDNKILKSRYYEQDLHSKILEDWTGKYENFLDEIPEEYRYW